MQGAVHDRRTLRPYFGLIAASVLLPFLIFSFAAWQNWRHLEWLAEGRAERRAALIAEHALKVFQGNEQVLRRIEDRIRGLSWDEVARSPEISTFLTVLPQEIDHLQGAGLIAPDGRLAAVNEIFLRLRSTCRIGITSRQPATRPDPRRSPHQLQAASQGNPSFACRGSEPIRPGRRHRLRLRVSGVLQPLLQHDHRW
jgi:hypothetical protein